MAIYKGAASEAGRAMQLIKKREKELEEVELRRKKIESNLKIAAMDSKFAAHYDAVEQQLKSSTIGLVTLEEMKAKQENIVAARERQLAKKEEELLKERRRLEKAKEKEKNRQKAQIQALSFEFEGESEEEEEEEDDDDDEPPSKKVKSLGKDPAVDTSFLPDKNREEEENTLREQLRQEWVMKQEQIKREDIDITFSYWDGSGHRNGVRMKKGQTIYQFLQKCLEMLRKQFPELRSVSADQLMYVKEDLIIPHHYSFYDFIVTKARGKSGPLFSFDVHDDIRIISDASVEKDESHAGKVLTRSWYEKNKHIFPASRWEPYDPHKNYEKYTISDGRGKKKKKEQE